MSKTQKRKDLLLTILIAAVGFSIPFVLYGNQLQAGNTVVSNDGLSTIVPDLPWMKNAIMEGEFPLWNPYLAGGTPRGILAGAPGLYPFNWLLIFVPVVAQLYAFFAIHLAMGGAFMFRYLRKLSCSPFVAAAVSVMYLFTVHMGGIRKEHTTLIVSALYVPVILYFAEEYLQQQRLKWLFLCAGAMTLQFLGGFLQYVIYTDIAVFLYLLAGASYRKWKIKEILARGVTWVSAYFGMAMLVILPTAQFMLYLADSSGEAMEFSVFKSYSLHPVKLLMSVIPELFGSNVWTGLIEQNYSSGIDAELVLGGAAISLLLASFSLCKKDFRVRVMTGILGVSLVYACMGNIPLVAQIVYKIPVLNMFRVPSRTLFLSTFAVLVLIACAMEEVRKGSAFIKWISFANLALVTIIVIAAVLYGMGAFPYEGERLPLWEVFKIPVTLLTLYLLAFYGGAFAHKKGLLSRVSLRNIVTAAVMVTMVIQAMPYYSFANISNMEENWAFSDEFVEQVGNHKVWSPDGSCVELVFNSAMTYPVQSLNAYVNLNLGNLYKYCTSSNSAPMNSSGLYNQFSNTDSVLTQKNNLLSMLGVKYIMLSPETNAEEYTKLEVTDVRRTIIEQDEAELILADTYQIVTFPVDIEEDKYYQISFTVDAQKAGDTVYTDLYFGTEYHSAHTYYFTTNNGELTCTAVFPPVGADAGEVVLRIVAITTEPLNITNVRFEEVDVEQTQQYRLVSRQNGYDIYENLFAKDLFYASESVASISKEERAQLYTQTQNYDILDTSYLFESGLDQDYSTTKVEISDIQLKSNSASAQVASDDECFINFSQTYYPGWKAFVDGEETELYEVNGIIQGCFVPAGEHMVEFRFVPMVFYLGVALSAATIIICVVCVYLEKRRTSNSKAPHHAETEG